MIKNVTVKKFIITGLILLILFVQLQVLYGQQLDYYEGLMDGQKDAKGNPVWILGGIFLIGNLMISSYKATPPPEALIGKPPNYVRGYTEAYQIHCERSNRMFLYCGNIVPVSILIYIGLREGSKACFNHYCKP